MTETYIPKRGHGHCDADHHWSDFVGRHDRSRRPGPKMTDFNLANMVFLAGRDDLDLGMYQTAAKTRIRWLSIELALEAERAEAMRVALEDVLNTSGARPAEGYHALNYADAVERAEALLSGKAPAVMSEVPPDLTDNPPPEPPWPAGATDNANAKREGWKAFFAGRARGDCPFPPARTDLWRDFGAGWDAANLASLEKG